MSGEHILKLLDESNCHISIGDKWLVCFEIFRGEKLFAVYQRKPYQKKTRKLIETAEEEEACKILKGE
mgnify:CR=1 FL=1